MYSEKSQNSEMSHTETVKPITNRKIYNRDDFFRLYRTTEIPDYLKDFQYLYNNSTEENWYCKPIPKFSEVPENKGRPVYTNNKQKVRQRTLSNQSGENVEYYENFNNKQRTYTGNGKFNRYGNIQVEMNSTEDIKPDHENKFINANDFEDIPGDNWMKVETRQNRVFNTSKTYAQNIQVTENHWKKWTKDSSSTTDKIHRTQNTPFHRSDKPNNIWLRKSENENRQRTTKFYGRHSVSKSGDQTEDIWQDDWDTEMKSEIAKVDDLNLDSFELSKSSILSASPPPVEPESQPVTATFETYDMTIPDYELWFYRDLENIERGPFSSVNMANWFATGYFNPATFVRRMCDERFLLLAEFRSLYGRIPFTAGKTIPPILHGTTIEIDVNQLLSGVENNLKPQVMKLASTVPQLNNVSRIEENVNISPNNSLLEKKRLLDEERANFEKEREEFERMKACMQAEMAEKMAAMKEMMQQGKVGQSMVPPNEENITNEQITVETEQVVEVVIEIPDNSPSNHECDKTVPVNVEPIASPVIIDKWEIDDANIPVAINTADNNQWLSTKDIKNQKKNKKAKLKETRNAKEEKQQIIPIPEAKPPAQPTDTRLIVLPRESVVNTIPKETVSASKTKPIRFDTENRKSESVSWNATKNLVHSPPIVKSLVEIQAEESERIKKEKISSDLQETEKESIKTMKPLVVPQTISTTKSFLEIQAEEAIKEIQVKEIQNISHTNESINTNNQVRSETHGSSWKKSPLVIPANAPPATKSLLEIQAEEALKEKRNKELQTAAKANEISANKITSFKESLLKTTKAPQVPVGKSIWDMLPTDAPVSKNVQKPELQIKKETIVEKKIPKDEIVPRKKQNEPDQLTLWCLKKLAKFSNKFELETVIELLKEVPNEEVMEMALQLLDDSKFTSGFVVEFINKRQELLDNQIDGDSWQMVKKSVPSPPLAKPPVSNNSKNKSAKSKSKKKMVIIDAKFR